MQRFTVNLVLVRTEIYYYFLCVRTTKIIVGKDVTVRTYKMKT